MAVTSVGLSLPNIFTVSNSPVTTTGTLTAILASQSQNLFLASPNGSSGTPSFRSIVAADIPTLNQNTIGTSSNVTGTVAIANGGTGQTSANSGLNALLPSQSGASGKVLQSDGANTSWVTGGGGGGSGTVTSVSVVTANGLSGTVANPTTTPAITLDISGLALTKLATIADQTILGNNSGGASSPLALTASQTKTVLSLNNVENTALSTWAGTTNITTLGTIGTGTWNGTKIAEGFGGTNQSTYTKGDILYSSAANTLSKLAGNTTAVKQYLSQTGTGAISAAPAWATIANTDITGLGTSSTHATGDFFQVANNLSEGTASTIRSNISAAQSGANTDITSLLLNQTGLVIKGGDANALILKPNETETANRTLNLLVHDVSRTIDLSGNLTVSSAATISGTNTGDQTITLGTDLLGSGSSTLNATIVANAVTTSKINNGAVTYAKIQNIGQSSALLGAQTSGNPPSEITLGGGLTMSGSVLSSSTSSGGNPTATVGTSATNGSSVNFMRADGAPAIDQTMNPTWTGTHNFLSAGIATTYTNQLLLENTTLSTSGVKTQQSPSLKWLSHVWSTTATAADSTRAFTETLIPVTSANPIIANLTWQAGNGGTNMNTVMQLSSLGALTTIGALSASNFSGTSSGTNSGDITLAGENYLSLTGQAITANAVTLSGSNITGTLPESKGGTNQSTYTLGDLLYSSASNTLAKLAGNTTSTNKFLAQTGTGTVSAAPSWVTLVSGDIPNNAANTSGSAAKLTTARTIAGTSFDGSANISLANKFIVQGTSDGGLSSPQFLGALATGIVKNTTTTGVLTIAVNSDLPVMSSTVGGAVPTPPNDATKYLDGTGVFSVPPGGSSGISGATNNGAMYALSATTGTSTGALTSGQLLIGGTTTPAAATLTGTSNQITITNGNNSITLSTPQNIHTAATPQFLRLGLGATADATANVYSLQTALGVTSTDGLVLINTTAAANNAQQITPRIRLSGQVWNTTGSTSTQRDWIIENLPVQSTTGTANLLFSYQANGGGYSEKFGISNLGGIRINGSTIGAGLVLSSAFGVPSAVAIATGSIPFATSSAAVTGNSANLTYTATAGVLDRISDAGTNTVVDLLTITHNSSGVIAAGFGESILLNGQTSTTADQNMFRIASDWVTATHASRASELTFSGVFNASALTKVASLALSAATTATLTLGVAGTTTGNLNLVNATGSNAISLASPASPSAYTLTFPPDGGTVGYFARTDGSGTITWKHNASAQSTPADPTGTTDVTGKMMGLAGSITPSTSGQIIIIISGDVQNSNALGGAKIQLRYGTGSAPANGDAATGTALGGFVKVTTSIGASDAFPFTVQGVVTGLTVATAYWIDLQIAAITTGTAAAKDISISAHEF
jgi:hypothetical protein